MMEGSVDALSFYQDNANRQNPDNPADQDNGDFFFSAIVSAEMRKNTAYNIRIRLDVFGSILNADCDCPAGQGPTATCKHVIAVLLTLVKFTSTGNRDIAGSCTDQLQTFKRPKPHTGGPVLAEKMGKGTPADDDDPRPLKYRNRPSYNDELFNATINYASNSGVDVSWKYAIPNKYSAAFNIVQKDHDYLKQPISRY